MWRGLGVCLECILLGAYGAVRGVVGGRDALVVGRMCVVDGSEGLVTQEVSGPWRD